MPLDGIEVGDTVLLEVEVFVAATNRLKGESSAYTYFRDPLEITGVEVETEGLEPATGPIDYFPGFRAQSAAECDGAPNPAAGEITLLETTYGMREFEGESVWIQAERTGGTEGDVSARIRSLSGTALSRVDYEPIDTFVKFADGQAGTQLLEVRVLPDDLEEQTERFFVELSEPAGCVSLGNDTRATVTDDDFIPDGPPTYSVGGVVSGLLGSGLELSLGFFERMGVDSSPYAFITRFENGDSYDVSISDHPSDPAQRCTAVNTTGVVQGADVTDVNVTCETPPLSANLDASFGVDGRVTDRLSPPAEGLALRADGNLVVVSGNKVHVYQPSGELDTTFGVNGQADIDPFSVGQLEEVALQSDGKIVVVGAQTRDFIIHRFNADGSIDTGFGVDGTVMVDFGSELVQSMEVARYNADGTKDTAFGEGGRASILRATPDDSAHALALQSDGKIIVAGAAVTDSLTGDFSIVRLLENGSVDGDFGDDGRVI